ncbi:regulating synaptic membrane exocytosis protein 2 isoform X4 [Nematostella vectensis]|uniref:regulating synaptic membrane exocytosis protein 2 isoform X4 n=1 Tax=Nematostella vectensis TaxID=45351 RepID=UPI00138FB232|nr:regulating synaptic membrane exocytosis protein 2 isoform X4 [Nematostella vectensis]
MAGFRAPASPPPPDLSHLTEEERHIILEVMNRQKSLEAQTQEMQKSMLKEVASFQNQLEKKTDMEVVNPQVKQENVCEICNKTKFTEGTGKECKYCKLKCCARCGMEVTIPGSKQTTVQWLCLICKKKQEVLTKTGSWFGPKDIKALDDPSSQFGNDFKAIPSEEDKRAMHLQSALHRSEPGRGSLRRRNESESERARRLEMERHNYLRRPSVSDEEVESIQDSAYNFNHYYSDDEASRYGDNRGRRKVTFHDEQRLGMSRQPYGPGRGRGHPNGRPMQGRGMQPGIRGGMMPQQGPGVRPGFPPGPQAPGQPPGMRGGYPQQQGARQMAPGMRPGVPHQQMMMQQQAPGMGRGGPQMMQLGPRPGVPPQQQQMPQQPPVSTAAGTGRGGTVPPTPATAPPPNPDGTPRPEINGKKIPPRGMRPPAAKKAAAEAAAAAAQAERGAGQQQQKTSVPQQQVQQQQQQQPQQHLDTRMGGQPSPRPGMPGSVQQQQMIGQAPTHMGGHPGQRPMGPHAHQQGHPGQQMGGHPHQMGVHPHQQMGQHPVRQMGPHPGQMGSHPQQMGVHPQQMGGHPQQMGGHPQQMGGHPQQMGGHPQQMGGPQQQMGGPQQQMGGPQQQMGGPQQQMGGPPQQMGGPQQQMGGPQQQMGGPQQQIGGPPQQMGGPQQQMGGPPQQMGGPPQQMGGPPHMAGQMPGPQPMGTPTSGRRSQQGFSERRTGMVGSPPKIHNLGPSPQHLDGGMPPGQFTGHVDGRPGLNQGMQRPDQRMVPFQNQGMNADGQFSDGRSGFGQGLPGGQGFSPGSQGTPSQGYTPNRLASPSGYGPSDSRPGSSQPGMDRFGQGQKPSRFGSQGQDFGPESKRSDGRDYGSSFNGRDGRDGYSSPRTSMDSRVSDDVMGKRVDDSPGFAGEQRDGFRDGIGDDMVHKERRPTPEDNNNLESSIKWSPPDDDNKCIGEVLLTKDSRVHPSETDPSAMYGLKVVGGKMSDDGKLAAFVTDVVRGGPADLQAKLQKGDEVLEWNEQSFVDCTFEEVLEIINQPIDTPELHLVLCRDKSKFSPQDLERRDSPSRRFPTSSSGSPVKRDRTSPLTTMASPQDTGRLNMGPGPDTGRLNMGPGPNTGRLNMGPGPDTGRYNMGPDRTNDAIGSNMNDQSIFGSQVSNDDFFFGGGPDKSEASRKPSQGRVQAKLFYDEDSSNLNVTVVGAEGLLSRDAHNPPNPYVRIYFLPDRSMQSKRRTKTAMKTANPKWNQTFVYPCRLQKFQGRSLEITVWDYNKVGSSEFIGEVVINMTEANLDGNPYWYNMKSHDENGDPLNPPTPTQSPQGSFRSKGQRGPGDLGPMGGYGSDYEDDTMRGHGAPNGMIPGGHGYSPDNERLKQQQMQKQQQQHLQQQLQQHQQQQMQHRDSPPDSYGQNQMIQAYTPQYNTSVTTTAHGTTYPYTAADHNRTQPRSLQHPGIGRIQDGRMSPAGIPGYHTMPAHAQYAMGRTSPSHGPHGQKKTRALPQLPPGREPMDEEERIRMAKQKLREMEIDRSKLVIGGSRGRMGYGQAPDHVYGEMPYDPTMSPRPGRHSPRMSGSPVHQPRPGQGAPHLSPQDRLYVGGMLYDGFPYESHRAMFSRGPPRQRRNSTSMIPYTERDVMQGQMVAQPAPSPVPLGQSGKSASITYLPVTEGGERISNGHIPSNGVTRQGPQLTQQSRSGSVNDIAVFSTGGYLKTSRQAMRNEINYGGSGRSSRSSSIADSDRSGSLTSIPGSVASSESGRHSLYAIMNAENNIPWVPPSLKLGNEGHLGDFIEGLGPSQMVGRQVLASPSMGDIQLGLCYRKGALEVEVIRAKGLLPKPGTKILPAPYVKVYVMEGKKCIAKKKTRTTRRTLEPLYQQMLDFRVDINGKTLQIIVWGDYGRMDRKVFMGVVQILLDDLDLSNLCMGWYKLFSTSSMCDPPLPSPMGGSPKKSPAPSPRSSHGLSPRMSPIPTIMPPPGHMGGHGGHMGGHVRGHMDGGYDEQDGDYV